MADTLAFGATAPASLIDAADLADDLVTRLKAYSALVKLLELSPQGGHLDSLSARELAELLHCLNDGTQAAAAQLSDTLQALLDAGRASSPADEQEGGAL